MSERKVLNKYYPPDFDPSKIPKGKRSRTGVFNIRIMAPFNMRCNLCKEYIYKGKKFNSRKENVEDEYYLGLRIFRFYIKCPRCVSEIAFKTDLKNTDYALEAGATRLFEAEKIAQQMAEKEQKEKEEDEMNPMKLLENRTKASRQEMDQIDSLEELREMSSRKAAVETDEMLETHRRYSALLQELQIEQEEKEIKAIFGEGGQVVKRLHDSDSDSEEPPVKKFAETITKPTDILAQDTVKADIKPRKPQVWERSVGSLSSKQKLSGLVVKKKPSLPPVKPTSTETSQGTADKTSTVCGKPGPGTQPANQNSSSKSDHSDSLKANNSELSGTGNTSTDTVASDVTKDQTSAKGGNQETAGAPKSMPAATGGGLLGLAYSDSDGDASD